LAAISIRLCCPWGAGGLPNGVWKYFIREGVVSGGAHADKSSCWPYEFTPCEHHSDGDRPACAGENKTPGCRSSCINASFDFKESKTYGRIAYSLPLDQEQIKAEILTNGPVQAAFLVYADFPSYSTGVYHHVEGDMLGGHAIKLVGWGSHPERGDYWIAANSWNYDWAGLGGFFYIKRGVNECGIESLVYSGLPRL
jgi:cathepsin B